MSVQFKKWLSERSAGLLCHVTSLPSETGIGNLGASARRLIDFQVAAGFRKWQICPLGPTGYGDSPYQCFSAFAGNPYLVDLDSLVGHRLLFPADLAPLRKLPCDRVDYGGLWRDFWPIIAKAADRFIERGRPALGDLSYDAFVEREAFWLDGYCWFRALKVHFDGQPWTQWPKAQRSLAGVQAGKLPQGFDESEVERQRVYQYFFSAQWEELRIYAADRGIEIVGDAPIFVAYDSADVWAHPEYFQLDSKTGRPSAVAGVPPDYFSEKGQLWGNPLYDWEALAKDKFAWWIERFKSLFRHYDIVRIDHFRGFADYWEVPAQAKDARSGDWKPGPGLPFFEQVNREIPELKVIAEDLGFLSDAARQLHEKTAFPGMGVLQFAFVNDARNPYLPHNMVPNEVIYTGTHDNDTSLGWYATAPESERHNFRRYLQVAGESPNWDLIRAAYRTVARLAVIPLQDVLNLGSEARLNIPGQAQGNWQWRYKAEQLETAWRESAGYLADLREIYGR